ncbi:WSC-domain-containing protein [Tricholoma matsutake]|nr:WSC-domain-containing protein [Tricholoma matsutake 945]
MAPSLHLFALLALPALVFLGVGGLVPLSKPSSRDVLHGTWTSKGCYTDISPSRTLAASSYSDATFMTIETCQAFCNHGGYHYAGVEYGRECYCDYAIQNPGSPTSPTECNILCAGSALELCGSSNRINIYFDGTADPVIPTLVGAWSYHGCYTDTTNERTLLRRFDVTGGVTAQTCTATCKKNGYILAGLEYGNECWCGNSLFSTTEAPATDCHMTCTSDHNQFCGGPFRLTLYKDEPRIFQRPIGR